jgi:hypothetical protein
MTKEIPVYDNLNTRTREEVEETARKWFETAVHLKSVQDELVQDLEDALNLVRRYQAGFVDVGMPDPGLVKARLLLTKYHMEYTPPAGPGRVYADGVDITEHPDSIPGEAFDIDGSDRMELVRTEDGQMHFIFSHDAEIVDNDE